MSDAAGRTSDLATRSLVGVIGGVALIGIILLPGIWSLGAFAILAALGTFEAVRLIGPADGGVDFGPRVRLLAWIYPVIVLGGFAGAWSLRVESGSAALLIVLFTTWAADVGAYFAGSRYGKTPLAPVISPKKTWEGVVGGFAAALAIGAIAGFLFDLFAFGTLAGLVAGIFGPPADLAESMLKRRAGVKDSGSILPGHGGILDRFDAFLVIAPICYIIARWIL